LAIIDYLDSVPTGRTANIIAATGLPRPAINCGLGDLVHTKEKVDWPFKAPPYMHWHHRRSGRVLTAAIRLKSGKDFYKVLDTDPTDPERAQACIVPVIKKLIREANSTAIATLPSFTCTAQLQRPN